MASDLLIYKLLEMVANLISKAIDKNRKTLPEQALVVVDNLNKTDG